MDLTEQDRLLVTTLTLLSSRCPRLVSACYWAGTSPIAIEELHHRQSFDLDFHTRRALQDTRPLLAELQKAFPGTFELITTPDEYGSGFSGVLSVTGNEKMAIEVRSSYEDVAEGDLAVSLTVPAVLRVSLSRYLADKIQCIVERAEARDLVDIWAVVQKHPEMKSLAKDLANAQDAIIIAERLLSWSDEVMKKDLSSYPDVNPRDAINARDLLLEMLSSGDVT